jgi:hypothetical protein
MVKLGGASMNTNRPESDENYRLWLKHGLSRDELREPTERRPVFGRVLVVAALVLLFSGALYAPLAAAARRLFAG